MPLTDQLWRMLVYVARPTKPSSLLPGMLYAQEWVARERGWLITGCELFLKTDVDRTQSCPHAVLIHGHVFIFAFH